MPNWNDLLNEVKEAGSIQDVLRRKYLAELHQLTGRNVIVYYSGWLQKGSLPGVPSSVFSLSDEDKNGFMTAIHRLDRSKGLDLLLHTPGGDGAATESLVEYLRAMFGTDIRAIVPQLAMSAGTMISLAARSVVMGDHSSLGPIDPQVCGVPAHGVIEEFRRAAREIKRDPARIPVWQPIVARYGPTFVGECEKAIKWANEMVRTWLESGMFLGDTDAAEKAKKIVRDLGSHALTKSHSRHISADKAESIGIVVDRLEANTQLQDAVLTVHHACIQTLDATPAAKIIENHDGVAFIQSLRTVAVPA